MKNAPIRRALTGLLAVAALSGSLLGATLPAHATAAITATSTATAIGGSITRAEVLLRAETWFNKGIAYNWNTTYPDPEGRQYRTDCSGYASMALHLPAPGPDTVGLADGSVTTQIAKDQLQPGDLVIAPYSGNAGHAIIFDHWTTADHSRYVAFQFGATPVRHDEIAYPNGSDQRTFYAYRYNNISSENRLTGVGDVFGNGRQSFVSINGDAGTLYYGNGTGSYESTAGLGAGWASTSQLAGVGKFDGVHANGMLALRTDGSLWRYYIDNTGGNASLAGGYPVTGGFAPNTKIAGVGDVFNNGRQSFVAVSGGTATLYYGNGTGSYESTIPLSGDWSTTTMITGVGYFDGENLGLLAYRADGSTWLYDIYNNSGYAAITSPSLLDAGFAGATAIAGVGYFDSVSGADFLYVQGDAHVLYRVSGTGTGSWRSRTAVTGGWI
ncbi:hypothetical protein QMK19_38685 [Streptomyces sp. H10-C2]|uniref:hypothetical protein n=1 Tax=unclassified Streptomyces TaxID=2593676 RepID=UPI0024BB4EBD|nr:MULTISPECIES: hypothetical protein [unclassified Streptomyces]MDJ0346844.1 hypothetical protein [Streptomyces sp. PH10-H1]MDJ0375367.1 hypothetical protein [Streptomyces sp. H10-C2]